ncbi:cupin domain-containing protein [Frigoriflavimonas asaccharolytica]|uniref:Quercetin dioxygenase-like cupin family protein n=1 Tax=Frigoriflavimonas asaccharolytica TaxID=2735899 RepID=A0A8J8K9R0_9FLAO|nr:cupin domain-containing protein [Frigoriflavimonas asaccharolytica]NRS93347.1 quercetin dioxygenase-like cupin family protein [Frigoriflavimonas asaccharolytica]
MNNIIENITFNNEKPSVFLLKKSDKIKYIAIALGRDAVLKKHTAPVPTTLLVLKGEINFMIGEEKTQLRQFDIFEIPVNVEHEVTGVSNENLFTLTQEL